MPLSSFWDAGLEAAGEPGAFGGDLVGSFGMAAGAEALFFIGADGFCCGTGGL